MTLAIQGTALGDLRPELGACFCSVGTVGVRKPLTPTRKTYVPRAFGGQFAQTRPGTDLWSLSEAVSKGLCGFTGRLRVGMCAATVGGATEGLSASQDEGRKVLSFFRQSTVLKLGGRPGTRYRRNSGSCNQQLHGLRCMELMRTTGSQFELLALPDGLLTTRRPCATGMCETPPERLWDLLSAASSRPRHSVPRLPLGKMNPQQWTCS